MKNLAFGASGAEVERLQERLREFGFYDGEITGEFDDLPGFRASFTQSPAQLVLRVVRSGRQGDLLMQ